MEKTRKSDFKHRLRLEKYMKNEFMRATILIHKSSWKMASNYPR